ncbi:(Fe-S)-binding protein [Lysobacter olei]
MPVAPPPSTDPLVALADRCVQCGLCLPTCPTYARDRLEAESPRGRIAIARGLALGTIEPSAAGDAHLDHCLACRSCEAVCPAGVEYGALIALHRTRQRGRRGASLLQRGIEGLAARPRWLAATLALYRWAFPLLPSGLRRLPRPPAPPRAVERQWVDGTNAPPRGAADATRAGDMSIAASAPPPSPTVALFEGCAGRTYEAPVRAQLTALCRALGYRVVNLPTQTCCGTLHRHAGDADTAARLATVNAKALEGVDHVLTLASGCHEAVSATVSRTGQAEDALAFLARHLDRLSWMPCPTRVAVHLPCTQRNVVRSVPALRRLLDAVPELQVVELTAGTGCCGAAGTAMFEDPLRAAGHRQPLLDQLAGSGASCLLSANLGCRLHLAAGTPLTVEHPLEWLLRLASIKNPTLAAP